MKPKCVNTVIQSIRDYEKEKFGKWLIIYDGLFPYLMIIYDDDRYDQIWFSSPWNLGHWKQNVESNTACFLAKCLI